MTDAKAGKQTRKAAKATAAKASKAASKGTAVKAVAKPQPKTTSTANLVAFGDGKKGHTVITAVQLAEALGHTDGGKRLRGWLRSLDNDGVYSRYAIDVDSKTGKALLSKAMAHFKVAKLFGQSA